MSLKTGRFLDNAEVQIDPEKCTVCGLCVKVCKGAPLYLEDETVKVDHSRIFGCIGCGHCMAVCPHDAIQVIGRDMSPQDIIPLPTHDERASYEQLIALMQSRRSIRNYRNREVEPEKISKILEAAATAPNGLASSDVEVMILASRGKVQEFTEDMITIVRKKRWIFSPIMLKLYRPFVSKDMFEMMRTFFHSALEVFIQGSDEGYDWMFYGAPLAMYFHVSPYADPADPYIPATYAMLAAQALGLGTCMIGTTSYLLNYFGKDIKRKYGISLKNKNGIMLIIGYPDVKFSHSIKRRFAGINIIH